MKGVRSARLVTRLGLLGFALAYGLPLTYLVATSLKTTPELFGAPAGLIFHPHLDAYHQVFTSALWSSLENSAFIAFGTAALTLVLGAPAACWLSRSESRLANVGLALLILLQMVPQTSSIIPLFRIMGQWGLVGSLRSVILADTALLLPFGIILLRPFFRAVPLEIEEAARVDGSSNLRIFFAIYLPLTRNGLLTVGAIIWVIAWGEFIYAVTFLLDSSSLPVSALLAQQVSQYGVQWNQLMAVAVLVTLPVLATFIVAYRYLREGLAVGAVK